MKAHHGIKQRFTEIITGNVHDTIKRTNALLEECGSNNIPAVVDLFVCFLEWGRSVRSEKPTHLADIELMSGVAPFLDVLAPRPHDDTNPVRIVLHDLALDIFTRTFVTAEGNRRNYAHTFGDVLGKCTPDVYLPIDWYVSALGHLYRNCFHDPQRFDRRLFESVAYFVVEQPLAQKNDPRRRAPTDTPAWLIHIIVQQVEQLRKARDCDRASLASENEADVVGPSLAALYWVRHTHFETRVPDYRTTLARLATEVNNLSPVRITDEELNLLFKYWAARSDHTASEFVHECLNEWFTDTYSVLVRPSPAPAFTGYLNLEEAPTLRVLLVGLSGTGKSSFLAACDQEKMGMVGDEQVDFGQYNPNYRKHNNYTTPEALKRLFSEDLPSITPQENCYLEVNFPLPGKLLITDMPGHRIQQPSAADRPAASPWLVEHIRGRLPLGLIFVTEALTDTIRGYAELCNLLLLWQEAFARAGVPEATASCPVYILINKADRRVPNGSDAQKKSKLSDALFGGERLSSVLASRREAPEGWDTMVQRFSFDDMVDRRANYAEPGLVTLLSLSTRAVANAVAACRQAGFSDITVAHSCLLSKSGGTHKRAKLILSEIRDTLLDRTSAVRINGIASVRSELATIRGVVDPSEIEHRSRVHLWAETLATEINSSGNVLRKLLGQLNSLSVGREDQAAIHQVFTSHNGQLQVNHLHSWTKLEKLSTEAASWISAMMLRVDQLISCHFILLGIPRNWTREDASSLAPEYRELDVVLASAEGIEVLRKWLNEPNEDARSVLPLTFEDGLLATGCDFSDRVGAPLLTSYTTPVELLEQLGDVEADRWATWIACLCSTEATTLRRVRRGSRNMANASAVSRALIPLKKEYAELIKIGLRPLWRLFRTLRELSRCLTPGAVVSKYAASAWQETVVTFLRDSAARDDVIKEATEASAAFDKVLDEFNILIRSYNQEVSTIGSKNPFSQADTAFATCDAFKEHLDRAIFSTGEEVADRRGWVIEKIPVVGVFVREKTKQEEDYLRKLTDWRKEADLLHSRLRAAAERMSSALQIIAPESSLVVSSRHHEDTAMTTRRDLAALLEMNDIRSHYLAWRGKDKPVAPPADFLAHCEKCFSHFRGEHQGFDHRSSAIANAADAIAKTLAMTASSWFTKEGWFSANDRNTVRCREVMDGIIGHDLRLTGKTKVANPSGASCVTELVSALDAYL